MLRKHNNIINKQTSCFHKTGDFHSGYDANMVFYQKPHCLLTTCSTYSFYN